LVENECSIKRQRAVRYAIFSVLRPYGTFRVSGVTFFYQHFVPNGTSMTLFMNVVCKNETRFFDTSPDVLDKVNKGIRENERGTCFAIKGTCEK